MIAHRAAVRAAERAGRRFGQDPVAYTTDPEWLVDMAVNRRAGWPDDPSLSRGSAPPVGDRFPKRAEGDGGTALRNLASRMSGGRFRVYRRELWIFPQHIQKRLLRLYPNRFSEDTD